MAKKSIIEEAKDLFSSWKEEIEEKDGHILERKKLREKEDEELFEEIKNQFNEVSADINDKAKKAFEVSAKEFSDFFEAVKEGSANIYKKIEIEKHLNQLDVFLNNIQSKGNEKFKNISEKMKNKMKEYDIELNSEVEEKDEVKSENKNEDIETLIKLAQQEYELKKNRLT